MSVLPALTSNEIEAAYRSGRTFANSGGSSRVNATAMARISGAANRTSGSIVAHAMSQEVIQWWRKEPSPKNDPLATAAAIEDVRPDWITPKTK